jgi:hypothetical protein
MRRIARRALAIAGVFFLSFLLLGSAGWGALAIYYSDLENPAIRDAATGVFILVALVAMAGVVSRRWRLRALVGYVVIFVLLVAWWNTIKPSNDRVWRPDVAVLPYATFEGDLVTVHNIRNFDYRSETDFSPAYYDKTFDIRKLDSVDIIASYWMGPAIAHTFLSFGFAGGDRLAVSIETRKEQGEDYSTIKGFFKQYELFYVVADERDVIRLRTNYRKDPPEDVYLFRIYGPQKDGQRLFLEYMQRINGLKKQPEFYNSLTTNCTTVIWQNARINSDHVPFSWKLLLSGYVPEYLYEVGRLDTDMPFTELYARSLIDARARAADHDPDFSQRIRVGLPGFNTGGQR